MSNAAIAPSLLVPWDAVHQRRLEWNARPSFAVLQDLAAIKSVLTDFAPAERRYVFQSPGWLEAWADTIAAAQHVSLCFVLVSDSLRDPLMLLALCVERQFGARVLTFAD